MVALDETDREIMELLLEDARRPYKEIAQEVNLSPPTISDRIDKLRELGVINRFTIDIDNSRLVDAESIFVDVNVSPSATDAVFDTLSTLDQIEHIFRTAEPRVIFQAYIEPTQVEDILVNQFGSDEIKGYSVHTISNRQWNPQLASDIGVKCTVCGREVMDDSVSFQIEDDSYRVCCSSCASKLKERYEKFQKAADEG